MEQKVHIMCPGEVEKTELEGMITKEMGPAGPLDFYQDREYGLDPGVLTLIGVIGIGVIRAIALWITSKRSNISIRFEKETKDYYGKSERKKLEIKGNKSESTDAVIEKLKDFFEEEKK